MGEEKLMYAESNIRYCVFIFSRNRYGVRGQWNRNCSVLHLLFVGTKRIESSFLITAISDSYRTLEFFVMPA